MLAGQAKPRLESAGVQDESDDDGDFDLDE